MLTREKILSYIHAIVTTLETATHHHSDCAESTLYLALGMDMQLWTDLRGLMLASDLISVTHHRVSLTEKGRRLAIDCNEISATAKA